MKVEEGSLEGGDPKQKSVHPPFGGVYTLFGSFSQYQALIATHLCQNQHLRPVRPAEHRIAWAPYIGGQLFHFFMLTCIGGLSH